MFVRMKTDPGVVAGMPAELRESIARLSQDDARWTSIIEASIPGLTPSAQTALGIFMRGLVGGKAPALLPFRIAPDDAVGFRHEAGLMRQDLLFELKVLSEGLLPTHDPCYETVLGLFSSIHRYLRLARAQT